MKSRLTNPGWLWVAAVLAAGSGTAVHAAPAPAAPGALSAPAEAWSSFRGTASLTGVSESRLPDAPVLRWQFKTGGPIKGSAAIAGGRVYVGSDDGKVYALKLADGSKVWEFAADGPVVASPLVLGDRVYIGSAGTHFFALDRAAGREVWRYGLDAEVKSSAGWFAAPKGSGHWLVFGGYDNRLHCLEAATGRTNWVYETSNYVNGAPAVADGMTVFGGCDAIIHMLRLADGTEAKQIEAGAYIIGSAAVRDGVAYIGHYENEFLAVDLKKGEVAWRYRDRNFPYGGSPAVTADRVIFGGRDKRVHCVDRATGKAVWVFATRGKVESSPVVSAPSERVAIGSDDGRLYLLGLGDGREVWNYEIGQPVQSSPAVAEGRLVVGADDGVVYCFGEK